MSMELKLVDVIGMYDSFIFEERRLHTFINYIINISYIYMNCTNTIHKSKICH